MNQSYRMLNIYKMVLYYTKVGSTFIPSCCFIIEKEAKVYFQTETLCGSFFFFFSFCFVFVLVIYTRLLEAFHFLFKNIFHQMRVQTFVL